MVFITDFFASRSASGIFYGLPKVQKTGCPIRPILSAILTFNYEYNLAKFFVPILVPTTTNEFFVKNSLTFANDILNISFQHPFYMSSFDVQSSFTCIPLVETINNCVEQCEQLRVIPCNLTISQLKSLLELAVK